MKYHLYSEDYSEGMDQVKGLSDDCICIKFDKPRDQSGRLGFKDAVGTATDHIRCVMDEGQSP